MGRGEESEGQPSQSKRLRTFEDRLAGEVMSVTVTFNTEHVASYQIGAATPVTGLPDTYLVEVPLFGYQSVEFTTKRK